MKHKLAFCLLLAILLSAGSGLAQRERIRLSNSGSTKISSAQATELTLTLSPVSRRPIQQIIRTGGRLDKTRLTLTADVVSPDAVHLMAGQRVRAFPPQSKSSMFQAKVSRVTAGPGHAVVEATLSREGLENTSSYVMEITIERGEFLAIPNEAIIEEGDRRVVYVKKRADQYDPQEIETGLQGELLTEVTKGLKEGDEVVTFGSFFIDANYKLKSTDTEAKR